MLVPIPQFTAPSYGDQTANAIQRCVNLYPVETSGGWKLVSCPGYGMFSEIDAAAGFRGAYYSTTGRLFCVANATVWELNSAGTKTSRGSIPSGSTLIHMIDNGIDMIIVGSGSAGYYLTMAAGSVTQITDVDFPGNPTHCALHNSRFIVTISNSATFYVSDPLSATNWTAGMYATAEAKGDTLVGVYSDGTNIHFLGKQSKETFYDTGNTAFPFERVSGAVLPVGCANIATAAYLDGSVYVIGPSPNGRGSVWEFSGTSVTKISTPYIESILKDFDTDATFTFCYRMSGFSFFQITGVVANKTLVYNITNKTWFERAGSASLSAYHNIRFIVNAFEGGYAGVIGFIGGPPGYALTMDVTGSVYGNAETIFNGSYVTTQMVRQRIFGPIASNSKRVFHYQIRIEAEVQFDALGATSISATLDWTDNAGLTYSTAVTMSTTVTSSITGQRVVWIANRLGSSAERYYRLTLTGPAAKIILKKCELDLQEGRF